MRRWIRALCILIITVPVSGCGTVVSIGFDSLTITLLNATDFPVDGSLYTNEDEEFSVGDITLTGDERTFSLEAGESVTFASLSCDDVQAVEITDADLRIAPGISPSASTDTLFDGDDYRCGDTLVFTFTQRGLLGDFEIVVAKQ